MHPALPISSVSFSCFFPGKTECSSLNQDEMYNNLERNKQRAKVRGYLEHKNKQWKIDIC
ncbi:hypothetical protein FKZ59_06455 [Ureibacillus terrenus]|uniref:Uncharacterized protein n=1 Tax=Ureibacillus terrenus TaxID=118246 RepID=A0A540V3G1_9BACL|nr:hypothetical protein FKZ59_06455 [Ureibacillus terrenus]